MEMNSQYLLTTISGGEYWATNGVGEAQSTKGLDGL